MNFVAVSFASPEYAKHAQELERSADEHFAGGHDRGFLRVTRVPRFASWVEACKFKPRFLRTVLAEEVSRVFTAELKALAELGDAREPRAILWVDADARFRRHVALDFDPREVDVAARVIPFGPYAPEPSASTIWLAPTLEGLDFVRRWISALERREVDDNLGDAEAFGVAFREWQAKGRAAVFPEGFSRMFDEKVEPGAPPTVIEHMQASRELRGRIGT